MSRWEEITSPVIAYAARIRCVLRRFVCASQNQKFNLAPFSLLILLLLLVFAFSANSFESLVQSAKADASFKEAKRSQLARIQFSDTDYPKEREFIARMFEKEFKEAESLPGSDKTLVRIAKVDINGDSKADLLVLLHQDPYFCGTEGCRFLILVSCEKNSWCVVLDNAISHDDIHISRHRIMGYQDVILSGGAVLRWNGRAYQFQK
jgi:hypothetical protein